MGNAVSTQWTNICSYQTHSLGSKCVCGQAPVANTFLVYLEPMERVWWLQMSSDFC